jgi:hypothetical protein
MATDNLVQLTVDIGTLSPRPNEETRQQYAEEIARRLLVYLPSTNATFNIGSSMPASDEGPWFKEVTDPKSGNSSYELWVWSSSAATYVPLTLNQIQLRYFVGTATPSQGEYDVWFETNSTGKPLGIHTYNTSTAAWEPNSYTPDEIDAFFEGEDAGKKQVDWDRVVNKPTSAGFNPRAVSGILSTSQNGTGAPPVTDGWNYEWEQVYHTGIGQMLIYDPLAGIWKTLGGGIGDLKQVNGTNIGTAGDFAAGTFGTILGKNPGWIEETAAAGRALVGANPSEDWDSLVSPTKKSPGSTHGVDDYIITAAQLPAGLSAAITYTTDINGGGPVGNGFMVGDTGGGSTPYTLSITGAAGAAVSNVQKSIAYHVIRKIN